MNTGSKSEKKFHFFSKYPHFPHARLSLCSASLTPEPHFGQDRPDAYALNVFLGFSFGSAMEITSN